MVAAAMDFIEQIANYSDMSVPLSERVFEERERFLAIGGPIPTSGLASESSKGDGHVGMVSNETSVLSFVSLSITTKMEVKPSDTGSCSGAIVFRVDDPLD